MIEQLQDAILREWRRNASNQGIPDALWAGLAVRAVIAELEKLIAEYNNRGVDK